MNITVPIHPRLPRSEIRNSGYRSDLLLEIRTDEERGRHFLARCIERKIELAHVKPGKPTQNAHVESFQGKLREECLWGSWFQNLFDA